MTGDRIYTGERIYKGYVIQVIYSDGNIRLTIYEITRIKVEEDDVLARLRRKRRRIKYMEHFATGAKAEEYARYYIDKLEVPRE